MKQPFTDIRTGAAFLEKAANGFEIKEMKNGKLFYISASEEYPQGYISDSAGEIIRSHMADATPANASAKLREAICMLQFANIITDDGELVPALMKVPEAPATLWSL